jgi:lysophospholipase L1-like esterase
MHHRRNVPRSALAGLLAVAMATIVAAGVPAAGAAAGTYVAVGDSYTAGPLILNQQLDQLGCFRSDHNYPHLVAQARGSALRDPSCSGAETSDLTSPQAILGGANPPQFDALDAGVATISVQIGGNDIGFTEILARCAAILPLGMPCRTAYTAGGVDEISRRIAATAPKVAAALAEARRRSPQARIFVVGYPAILPEVGPGCWPLLPIAPDDVAYLRDKEKELNAMLASQAVGAGATYVDVYTPSIGHDACQLPGVRWVEPLVPLAPAAPVHPNALGMQGMATVLAGAMGA